ncbi:heterokaryon incompatibility protein-domain-containing protein, partial [Bisporella sp. PMI_857]
EIRLIRMSRRLPGAELKCTFVQIAIEKAPQYEAISYTWGTGEKDRLIFIEDRWLPVTRNVHKILEDRGSYLRTRWLWIDAVCINQDNLEEKSTQVAMMGDIYSGADRVIVWLDNKEITHSEVRDANFLLELIAFNSMNLSKDLYDPPTRVLGSYTHWKALSRLLSHPYWHRVWIIQEIAMAKKVHILYGSTYLSWEQLSK